MVGEWWNAAAEYNIIGESGEEVCGRSTGIELYVMTRVLVVEC